MPPRSHRRPSQYAQDLMPLLIAGVALVASNRYFTMIDDEATILNDAVRPLGATLSQVISGQVPHQHPPLFDVLLNLWLRATGGNFEYLRILPIVLFLAGLFCLVRAARRVGGPTAAMATAWTGALWPFGFHYGRLVVWYSLAFLLISGLTLAYLRYLEKPDIPRWAVFFFLGAALLWTNYFGWVVLVCLALDQWLRRRSGESGIPTRVLAGTAALWLVAFIPLLRAFRFVLGIGMQHQRALTILPNAAFNVYSLFVSESVAPWNWLLSVPAGLAVLAAMALVFLNAPPAARRFLYYSAFMIVVMALTGILLTRRLFLVAPWVLLPIGVAISSNATRWMRAGLALALLIFAGIGWYGIYSRRYYAAPRFLEPWLQVAGDTAFRLENRSTGVIANSPSFFLYMTYLLRVPITGNWKYAGSLPNTVHAPDLWSPEQWIEAGHPTSPTMLWIRGMDGPQNGSSMDDASQILGHDCGSRTSRMMMRDAGFSWKQRFFPELGELPWRIEIREYDCTPGASTPAPSATPAPAAPPPSGSR